MTRKSQYNSTPTLLGFMLLSCALLCPAIGRSLQTQQPQPSSGTSRPVPLAHLYSHFLIHLNHLDVVAASELKQGKDSAWLRNLLETKLGFSDADFVPLRASSVRLTAELAELKVQAATIRAAGASAPTQAQLIALSAQRETYINAEIAYLKQNLSQDKITALENFLYKLFSQNNPVSQTDSSTGQSSSTRTP